jgi:uncharacterized protein YcaQ
MTRRARLSIGEARRIALAAQGFDRPRPGAPTDVRHFRRALASIAVLQLDFVNVLLPAHFLMIWSRLGAYDRSRFEKFLYDSGEYTEQWAHEASIVSSSDWPLLEHRRQAFKPWKNSPLHKLADKEAYLRAVLEHVQDNGCTTSNDLPSVAGPKRKAGDWHRSIPRCGLEHHFGSGAVAVRRRLGNFQRVYDQPDRVIDSQFLTQSVDALGAQRELLRKASVALGVATSHDLADYYRMTVREAAPRLEELVEEGALSLVTVEGWSEPAFLSPEAKLPRKIAGASLLSPFDPMIWFRPRAKRLFNFDYRIEIYVPKAQRRWGYYVLPFRLHDNIAARIDLKADRKHSLLCVQNAHLEPGADQDSTGESLADELRALAQWLKLTDIKVKKVSAFEKTLTQML